MSTDGEVTVFCVGLGRQFAGHLSSALAQHRSNVLVGGLCDIRPDQCESIRRYLLSLGISFSRSAVYTEDFAFLLEHAIRCRDEHPGRYMFIVSTGAETHFTLCELCLRNGFHVYVDKPFVLNVRDGEQLVALADAQGIAIGVGAQRRFESVYRRLLVEAREIGQIRRIHFHHHGNFAQFDPNSPEGNVIPTGFGYHAVDTVAWLLHELYFGDPDLRLIGAVVRKWENNREYHQSFDSLFVCDTNDGPIPVTIACSHLPPRDTVDELFVVTGSRAEIQVMRKAVPRNPVPGEVELAYWDEAEDSVVLKRLNRSGDKADRGAPLRNVLHAISSNRLGDLASTGRNALPTLRAIDQIINKATII